MEAKKPEFGPSNFRPSKSGLALLVSKLDAGSSLQSNLFLEPGPSGVKDHFKSSRQNQFKSTAKLSSHNRGKSIFWDISIVHRTKRVRKDLKSMPLDFFFARQGSSTIIQEPLAERPATCMIPVGLLQASLMKGLVEAPGFKIKRDREVCIASAGDAVVESSLSVGILTLTLAPKYPSLCCFSLLMSNFNDFTILFGMCVAL